MHAKTGPTSQAAETMALEALGFLASEEDRLLAFIGLTGSGLDEIRSRAGDPAFLAGVMDYLLADEALLLAFAEDRNIKPDAILRLRRALPGATDW